MVESTQKKVMSEETYKGYEILLHETEGQWEYNIPAFTGYGRPLSYKTSGEALEEARKAIDNRKTE